jgi:hypothetical protein
MRLEKDNEMSVRFAALMMLTLVTVLGFTNASLAAPKVAGPAIDFKGDYFTVPDGDGVPTVSYWQTIWGSPYQAPTWGAPAAIFPYPPSLGDFGYGAVLNAFNDYITIGNGGSFGGSTLRYGAAAAYIGYDDESLPTDNMVMTTVYGQDLDPFTPDALEIGGYDTSGLYPQLSDEHVTGPSGTVYSASAGQLVPILELPTILGAGADLSIFTGDRSLSVWVFQTTMPFSEAAVPEPSTYVMLVGAAVMAGAVARRRRS